MRMKKLLLLCLALAGMVGTVSAETITRRVWAYCNWGGDWQSTDHSLRIHYFKSDGTDITSWAASATQYMTRFNSTNWFYYDITADESVLSSVKVIIRANSGNGQTYNNEGDTDVMDLVNNCYKLIVETVNNADRATVSELKYYLLNSATKERSEMTTSDCLTFEGTINNQTSQGQNYYVVAPSFAFNNDFSEIYWGLVFRPWAEHQNLSFENVSDRTFFAEDGNNNAWCTNSVPASFKLSLNTLTWKYAVSSFFTRTINAASTDGYATFSSPYDVKIPAKLTAYYGKEVNNAGAVVMSPIENANNEVKAGDGILLKGKAGTNYDFTPAENNPKVISGNLMVGNPSTENFSVPASTGSDFYYVYGKDNAGLGFYKVVNSGIICPVGGAYLHTNTELTTTAGARAAVVFSDDEATGINTVKASADTNGFYDLQGRRVANPVKGLYIVNGKKVIY